ncbi:MAG: CsbD family protein [Salinivenus sp.]
MDSPKKQQAEGNWKQFKGKMQELWGDVTGDDMDRFEGNREQLEGHLQEKTGENREAIRKKIDNASRETKYTF